ncbi:MAG: hypothetical protein AMS26_11640 [Bacteroides sp. SM23_62]|nr:MAG: hypothetical protein AMS26_11640 [Bacteroides sp. SM23_62]
MRGNANLRQNMILIISLLLVGCTPMAEISIQVMEPAEITLPSYINQVAFINHSYVPRYDSEDTAGFTQKEIYILDTVINNQIFLGLRIGLNESPLFDLDSIHIIQFRRNDTIDFLKPLTRNQIRVIKQSEQAEALISLEYYRMRDTISINSYQMDLVAKRQIISHTVWRIYDLTSDSIFDEYMLKDTTEWYVIGDDRYYLMNSLPEFINSLRTASYNAGFKYGQRISPYWFDVPRFYHTSGGKDMRIAKKKAASLDWKGASDIWKKLAYQVNEKTAAKACFNMALVCEMEDLLIPALDWAIKSYLVKQDPVTKGYIDLLKDRYEKQKIIKTQLPVEE